MHGKHKRSGAAKSTVSNVVPLRRAPYSVPLLRAWKMLGWDKEKVRQAVWSGVRPLGFGCGHLERQLPLADVLALAVHGPQALGPKRFEQTINPILFELPELAAHVGLSQAHVRRLAGVGDTKTRLFIVDGWAVLHHRSLLALYAAAKKAHGQQMKGMQARWRRQDRRGRAPATLTVAEVAARWAVPEGVVRALLEGDTLTWQAPPRWVSPVGVLILLDSVCAFERARGLARLPAAAPSARRATP